MVSPVPGCQALHHPRQVLEAVFAGDEHIEGGLAQQRQGEREPLAVAARGAPGCGHGADLGAHQAQAPGVEAAAQGHAHLVVAVPAQLEHRRFERGQRQGRVQSAAGGAGVHDQVLFAAGPLGVSEVRTQCGGNGRPGRVDVHQLHLHAGDLAGEMRHEAAQRAGADHRHPIAHAWRHVPQCIDCGLHVGGQHGPLRRYVFRQRQHGVDGHAVAGLMRMQAEDLAPAQRGGPCSSTWPTLA